MSEDDHSSAASNPKRSRPLRRRLRLLQSVLPEVLAAAADAFIGGTERDRLFWGRLLNPYENIKLEQRCFDLLHDAHGDLVEDVLNGLEEVVQVAGLIPEEYKQTLFPRSEILTEQIEKASDPSEIRIEIAVPQNTNRIIESLSTLAAVIKDSVSQSQPRSDAPLVSSKTKPVLATLISNLFSALFTYRERTLESITKWLETGITVHESLPQSGLRTDPHISMTRQCVVRNICSLTGQRNMARVNLKVIGGSLYRNNRAENQMMHFQNCEPANLREAFLENTTDLKFSNKICLAVVLSYSFLHFCGKPWFAGGWNRDNIFLMHNNTNVSLQPFLITEIIEPESGSSIEATTESWEAKLLDHGILLMEILNQDTFPSPPKQAGETLLARKDIAEVCKRWVEPTVWKHHPEWRQAVEACISGRLINNFKNCSRSNSRDPDGPDGSQSLSLEGDLDKAFAGLFYEEILTPLETAFASEWPGKDPDKLISTLKIRYLSMDLNPSATRGAKNSNRRTTSNVATRKPPYNSRSGSLNDYSSRRPWYSNAGALDVPQSLSQKAQAQYHLARINKGRLFDASECSNLEDIEVADEWFNNYFDKIRANLFFGSGRNRSTLKTKIRIGVLDTGIDMSNNTISQNRNKIRCWPPGADHHDNVGHGTHVAFLLLHLAKHVDLRICKITDSVDIEDASIKQIADPGEDRVDILNLSFGFPEYHDKLEPINKAIHNATSSGIIIFAAAGNEGGNAAMCWPALLHMKSLVIPVCSTDGKGWMSRSNPSFDASRYICALGKGVKSCHVRDVDGVQQVIHRSGSSFATPIAAATAAIILGFVDNANPSPEHSEDLERLKPRLRTRLGMEMVMCEVCVQAPKGLRQCYLTPWSLFEFKEAIQIPVIIKILERVTP
ncbi:peptidase S8/S53 domain-containing protein [Trichoderma sp. SZMC 28015]